MKCSSQSCCLYQHTKDGEKTRKTKKNEEGKNTVMIGADALR